MNQEQLLDHVADLLKTEAKKGPGTLLLTFTDDFKVIRLDKSVDEIGQLLGLFDASYIESGLAPSSWLALAKKVWACKSTSPKSIKFPGDLSNERNRLPSDPRDRTPLEKHKPPKKDDPGKVG